MDEHMIDVVVARRHDPVAGIAVLDLERADGGALPAFAAGAHIDVCIGPDLTRQYSLCNPPDGSGRYRIGVLNDPQSRGGSRGLHRDFQPGTRTRISPPRNHFPLDPSAPHSILIGGGIGVTPMLAMAYALRAAGRPFALHYCVRSRDVAGFASEILDIFAAQARLHTDDGPPEQRLDLAACLGDAPAGAHVYVCGPTGFMDWVIATARQAGFSDSRIHFEYFNAKVDSSGGAFEVLAKRSGKAVTVAAGQSIIDALAGAGIRVRKSCEQGVCGTCLCDVVEGTPDHRDSFLTDDEKAEGDQIILCCSRALTPRLVLDI